MTNERINNAFRERLGNNDYIDISHEEAVLYGFVRASDEHRGPVRISRPYLYPDTKKRERRLGRGDRQSLIDSPVGIAWAVEQELLTLEEAAFLWELVDHARIPPTRG